MKKKNLKSLKLNKKVISNIEASKVEGGFFLTVTCTFGEICLAAAQAGEAFYEGFVEGWNESANN